MNRLKRLFLFIVAIFFPWAIFLYYDNPGAALLALIMQATLIGWPFAAVWARRVVKENNKKVKEKKKG